MKDCHLHYTGSLPREFLFSQLLRCNLDFLKTNKIKNLYDFDKYIDGQFGSNYKENRKNFDCIYTLFQSATKLTGINNIMPTYGQGAYEIARQATNNGLSEYAVISGLGNDIKATYDRYIGMINGFKRAEKELGCGFGKIVITFIRGADGKIKNSSQDLLCDLFKMIAKPTFVGRVSGFDISGYEYPNTNLFNENIKLLNLLIENKKSFGLDIEIGLHAGEIITNTEADLLYDDYFRQLSKLDVGRIRHGTYLWHNKKNDILKLFAGKCVFDICPKSNFLLTPATDIPTAYLKSLGIEFTLNRDDPSIFNNWDNP